MPRSPNVALAADCINVRRLYANNHRIVDGSLCRGTLGFGMLWDNSFLHLENQTKIDSFLPCSKPVTNIQTSPSSIGRRRAKRKNLPRVEYNGDSYFNAQGCFLLKIFEYFHDPLDFILNHFYFQNCNGKSLMFGFQNPFGVASSCKKEST